MLKNVSNYYQKQVTRKPLKYCLYFKGVLCAVLILKLRGKSDLIEANIFNTLLLYCNLTYMENLIKLYFILP